MHEEEVKDLADQALKADKIITEQLFGWKWKAPDIHALQQVYIVHTSQNISWLIIWSAFHLPYKVLGRHGGMGLGAEALAAEDKDDEKEEKEESADKGKVCMHIQ